MTDEKLEIKLTNKFYKDSRRKLILALFIAIVLITLLTTFLGYIILHPPQPKYFATSINGRITPLIALDEPNQADSAVLQWANQAAIAAYTYNFVNYARELNAASSFFTTTGWNQFLYALQSSKNIDTVTTKKLVVSAVATRAPVILQKGELSGRFSWRIQIPLLITYQSASEFDQQNVVITMLVARISPLESPRGIGIEQFIVVNGASGSEGE